MTDFILAADCKLVKGTNRSMIYDLTKMRYYVIPNSLYYILKKYNNLEEIKSLFNDEDSIVTIEEYFDFLLENEIIIFLPKEFLGNFIPLKTDYHYPGIISNALLYVDGNNYDICAAIKKAEAMGCMHFQLKFSKPVEWREITKIIDSTRFSNTRSIEFILKYNDQFSLEQLKETCLKNERIKAFIFYESNVNEIINVGSLHIMGNIAFTQQKIDKTPDYRNNSITYMNSNISLFSESQKKHSYFNGKLFIDEKGEIKNYQGQDKYFGNINSADLSTILTKSEYTELWHVKKDQTAVCKDCEFRYMCTDSRIPKKMQTAQLWYHENECNYNPYISLWHGEKGYKTLAEIGVTCNTHIFKVDLRILKKSMIELENC